MNRKRIISLLAAALLAALPVMDVMAEPSIQKTVTGASGVNTKETEQGASQPDTGKKAQSSSQEQTEEGVGEETEAEITSVESANETLKSYSAEEMEWEEITIDSVEDFMEFSRNCRLDTWSVNKKVYLDADLSLATANFVPIPTFGGYFDGQGHTISALYMTDSVSYTGLFDETQQTAVIANLNVAGIVSPSGNQMAVGGLVGKNRGIILNCTFDGTVKGDDYIGGIAGLNELTGIIMNCTVNGKVKGLHYTGGIAGENMGNIVGCVNRAQVNTSNEDVQMSLEQINLEQYANNLLNLGEDEADRKVSTVNSTIDTGGIAGLSTGIIQYSTNEGEIGYEHVGYNTGGIVGRQSGYLYFDRNTGTVYGRKDVGGIVGQAEPYVAVDLSEDIAYQLADNINELHSLIGKMLDDTGSESETLSNRLTMIQSFADKALDDTSFLADRTVAWTDGVVGAANDAMSRLDYVMDEVGKDGGVLDEAHAAAGNLKDTVDGLSDAVDSLDIYQYMTEEERQRYDDAKKKMQEMTEEYSGYYADMVKACDNYCIDERRVNAKDEDGNSKYMANGSPTETDLVPCIDKEDGNGPTWQDSWSLSVSALTKSTAEKYIGIERWGHMQIVDGEKNYYDLGNVPDSYPDSAAQNEMDRELLSDAAQAVRDNAEKIEEVAREYAGSAYKSNHAGSLGYTNDLQDCAETISEIVAAHTAEMSEEARKNAQKALDDASDAAGNMKNAGGQVKNIASTLNGMSDLQLPQLGSDYRSRTNSLAANLKGISENMGYLNNEMLSTSDVMIEDLEAINDQFSSIMILYTDALDGVLDMDYSAAFEDQSKEEAEDCTDATIADCINSGEVKGDINVSGIAGTMAIEYDFDLESDVTGFENAKANSTFLTKCVLRQNENRGKITAQKSYAGGIVGLQEMGMLLRCENYGKIQSVSGDYVGGVAGQSLSDITNSFAKCMVSGGEYVAGIAGAGSSIEDCYAMVKINEATAFSGAIAGTVDDVGSVYGNYFVSDEIAGIDRISYSGKAEPLSYKELLEVEGLPQQFRMMKITFYADEKEVKQVECRYGGSVSADKYPDIPVKDGFYADWDIKELEHVVFDEDVTVEYVRYLTTLAGKELRDNGQSVLLADGRFKEGDVLDVTKGTAAEVESAAAESKQVEGITELWTLEIPDDGNEQHQIRYQAPQGQIENVVIYVKNGGKWQEAQTEEMGIYHLFTVEGAECEIAVELSAKTIKDYIVFIVIGAVLAAVIVVVIVLLLKKRKKKNKICDR